VTRLAPVDVDLLAKACTRGLGNDVAVEHLRRLSGGASRETWAFDVVRADGEREALVLRRDPSSERLGSSDRSTEYALLRSAHEAGVPVPAVRFRLEPDDALGDGFVMTLVEGETIPRKILRDDAFAQARPRLAAQCGTIAARIHAVDVDALPPELAIEAAGDQVGRTRDLIDGFGEPHPAFELALRWLADEMPGSVAGAPTRLVHGDFRNGNFIVGAEGIRSVLDWELAHLGDPAEDLGWLCVKSWRFGHPERRVGGFGDVDALLDAYTAAGGEPVNPDRLRWWEVLGTLKWGVICQAQTFTHLHGLVRSVELAALGRRVAETEWDLLELIK